MTRKQSLILLGVIIFGMAIAVWLTVTIFQIVTDDTVRSCGNDVFVRYEDEWTCADPRTFHDPIITKE